MGFLYFILFVTFSDHFSNERLNFLQRGFVFCSNELHGLKTEPYVMAGISSMLRLKVVLCFLLIIGQMDGQLAAFIVCRRAGIGHIMVVFLYI